MTDAELIREAIRLSGLTVTAFAFQVMSREDRTVRRWLAGQAIPKAARAFLEADVAEHASRLGRGGPK